MNILITLLIAHLFADFPLQTNALAKLKEKYWHGVLLHVLVHVVVTALLIHQGLSYWPLLLGLGGAHFVIDSLKLLCPTQKGIAYFLVDQLLHLATIVIAAYLLHQDGQAVPVSILPQAWLLPILSGAFVPAIMVFLWIWANSLSQEFLVQSSLLYWTKYQILSVEQRIGVILFLLVCLQPSLYSFVNILQDTWR